MFVAEAPAGGDPGTECFDDDVGPAREFPHARATLVGPQVGDEALLAAVPHQEPGGVLVTQPVSFRWFHLEYAGAVVGEHHACQGRADAAGTHLDHL